MSIEKLSKKQIKSIYFNVLECGCRIRIENEKVIITSRINIDYIWKENAWIGAGKFVDGKNKL